jgi:signal transduction histidine kinase
MVHMVFQLSMGVRDAPAAFVPLAGVSIPALFELRAFPVPGACRIEVSDNGPGIPLSMRDRIFDKFVQLDDKGAHRKYSTGLGLTFCKLAVEVMGGKIGVDGIPGEGSIFWLELPLDVSGTDAEI